MLATAAAIVLAIAPAQDANPRTVAIVTTQPHAEVTRVVADELEAAGYEVHVRSDASSLEPSSMGGTEPCESAWACVGLSAEATGWTAQLLVRDPGALSDLRPGVRLVQEGPNAPQTLGLQLAEALHAAESPPAPPPKPAPPKPAPTSVRAPELLLGAEATLMGSPGGASATLGPSVALTYFPHRVVGIDVALHATALEARRPEPEGLARLGLSWAWFGVAFRRAWPRVGVGARVGGGPLIAWARGNAVSPFSDRTQVRAGGVAGAAPFVDVRLHRALYLRTSGWVLFTIPKLGLSVAGRRVASVGLPLLGVSIGLAWGRA